MKTISTILLAMSIIAMTSCEKAEIQPTKTTSKAKKIDCRKCEGQWDITDSIP